MFTSKKKIAMWASCGDDFYYGQNGEKVDYELAVDFYEKAAKKKHPHATYMLGLCYELGRYVDKDLEYAEMLYEDAADYGDEDAKKRLAAGKVFEPGAPKEDDDEEEETQDDEEEDDNENMTLALDFFIRKKYKKAFPLFEQEAKAGNSEAQYYLGLMYLGGNGTKEDFEEAAFWFKKAAAQGNKDALEYLDDLKEYDDTVQAYEENEREIAKLNEEIKEDTEDEIYFNLLTADELLTKGFELDQAKDYKRAAKFYLEAAEGGNKQAQYNIGYNYYYGEGIEQDYKQAEYWHLKAAEQKHIPAYSFLGTIYANGCLGKPDYGKAVFWHEKSAAEENEQTAKSQWALVNFYATNEYIQQDMEKAIYWLQVLAANGDEDAQTKLDAIDLHIEPITLAIDYEKGNGREQDMSKSVYWTHKTALSASAIAMTQYACLLLQGKGVETDAAEAAVWLEKAAGQGNATAQVLLGDLYREGNGVEQDIKKARLCYNNVLMSNTDDDVARTAAAEAINTLILNDNKEPDPSRMDVEQLKDFGKFLITNNGKEAAFEFIEIAAMRGDAEAQMLCYLIRYDNDFPQKVDAETAEAKNMIYWLLKAAENGDESAQGLTKTIGTAFDSLNYSITELIALGDDNYEKEEYERALYWYRVAAKRGNSYSAYMTGYMLYMGYGADKDYKEAYNWLLKSLASETQRNARYFLGMICFDGGYGMQPNYSEALSWFLKSLVEEEPDEYTYKGIVKAYLRVGDEKNARKYYEKMEKRNKRKEKRDMKN